MRSLSLLVIALLLALLGWLFLRREGPPPRAAAPAPRQAACPTPPASRAVTPAPWPDPAKARWLAIGAVESPEANQISIEQDVELLRTVLGSSGVALLAGGPGSRDVQVQLGPAEKRGDALLLELADLLTPRGGRYSRYRRGQVPRQGPATLEEVRRSLDQLLHAGRSPLLLYVGGHGEMSQTARQGYVTLWGGQPLGVEELAGWLDQATSGVEASARPVQLVVTTCYAGAFAEALFREADPARGVAVGRCGFFATAADLPASGCDPNPDRESQEAYALHLLNALRRRDRSGGPMPAAEVDLDGDGRVSLSEAHARARVNLDSVDVPSSTSERWLRQAAPRTGPRGLSPLPEEHAVARALAERTRLREDLGVVKAALAGRERGIDKARRRLDEQIATEEQAARRAAVEILGRWPVLDDPWHPDFAELLRCQRRAIEEHLQTSSAYADYLDARDVAGEAERKHWDLRRQAAPVERLARALENIALAERLHARGGAAWRSYESILACERLVP